MERGIFRELETEKGIFRELAGPSSTEGLSQPEDTCLVSAPGSSSQDRVCGWGRAGFCWGFTCVSREQTHGRIFSTGVEEMRLLGACRVASLRHPQSKARQGLAPVSQAGPEDSHNASHS